ncbi:hypothetical protein T440DRAFT_398982, partial [Plenodomus tracheiphilus IPT5]
SIEVISDAGDQQQQHQELDLVQSDGLSGEDYDLAQSLASLPPLASRHELQTNILDARQRTRNNEGQVRRFIPKEELCRVIDLASVARELRKVLPHLNAEEISSYSKAVCQQTETKTKRHGKYQIKSFRKIFALLVLLETASSIVNFLEEDVSDQDLPLKLVEQRGKPVFLRKGDRTEAALRCFSHEVWSPVKLETFQEYQWLLLAPFFSPVENGIVKHYVLQTQHILPFVASDATDDNTADKLGGYGKVLMVHIHPDHHNFQDSKHSKRGFAVKQQIDDEDREAFKQEAEILRKFSGENAHPHVVSLLATYEQFNKFHLVFYRAEGDLLDYWRKFRPRPQLSYDNIMWMAQQCAGLADGLSRLHKILSFKNQKTESQITSVKHAGKHVKIILPLQNRVGTDSSIQSNGVQERTTSPIRPSFTYDPDGPAHHQEQFDEDLHRKQFGRHGDIHPKNILWYSDGDDAEDERSDDQSALSGNLVIADFGQAEVNSFLTKTKRRDVANTLTYRPPECDLQPTCIRQSYDIWRLGCVYLEFVTWLLGGRQLLHKFSRDRLTPDIVQFGNDSDTFFEVFKNQEGTEAFMVKPAVTKFIDQLHQHRNCTDYLHQLLDIIQHDMLLVDSTKRKSCAGIRDRLNDMHYECRRNIDYATAASPWCIPRPPLPCAVELEMTAYARRVSTENLDSPSAAPAPYLWLGTAAAQPYASLVRLLAPIRDQIRYPTCITPPTVQANRHLRIDACRPHHLTECQVDSEDDFGDFLASSSQDHSLESAIIENSVAATFHDPVRKYLPERSIASIITKGAIEKEFMKIEPMSDNSLQRYDKRYRAELATWTEANARKVFATMISCQLPANHLLLSMILCRRGNFQDRDLPLEHPDNIPPPTKIFRDQIWTTGRLDAFHRCQWRFLAPVFIRNTYDYDLSADCIFPFSSDGAVNKDGAFSSVYRVSIHQDHQDHPGLHDVALKEVEVRRGDEQAGMERAWELEASALEAINKLDHPHIIKCIAAVRRGRSRYFLFPWADGDSLRAYWDKAPRQTPDGHAIREMIIQLKGIADALDRLHNFDGTKGTQAQAHNGNDYGSDSEVERDAKNEIDDYKDVENAESIRHGDLKPENILMFQNESAGANLGILKIADMGLAKRHVVATQKRDKPTSTRYGTRRYEAPETVTGKNARSRLYDIWSMGCITLEFMVWTLYGNEELGELYKQIEGIQGIGQYYKTTAVSEIVGATVHPVIEEWMEHIRTKDPECSSAFDTAIKDLLKVVQEKLLVIPLPPNRRSSTIGGRGLAPPALGQDVTRYRATAAQFRDALEQILEKSHHEGYLFTRRDRTHVKTPRPKKNSLSPDVAEQGGGRSFARLDAPMNGVVKSGVLGRPIAGDYTNPPREGWEYEVDNIFAEKLLAKVGSDGLPLPKFDRHSRLCDTCANYNFWKGGFTIEEWASTLQQRGAYCDLCQMLDEVYARYEGPKGEKARLVRDQSNIMIAGDAFPVLSIVRSPVLKTPIPIQIGYPELPSPGSRTFFDIIKLWLQDCDTDHKGCQGTSHRLPTRLIDVGNSKDPKLQLVETSQATLSSKEYIALSHPWGNTELYDPFSTVQSNVEEFRQAIPEDSLPATFKDAVICVRELGISYLWIDSLCIIQGEDGDFNEEATRMEDVFSGAYCILAASRANDQRDGFLSPRSQRTYVTFQDGPGKSFFICENIDNFGKDVILGSLNKRGWVLQERALARRTIYFTETQTYFECGKGIRCETLTRKRNKMADFLGDPDFPKNAMTANRAAKIAWFQALYQQYSNLDFTRYEDRPIAIAGLEKRLQKAYGTRGAYGIFDDGNLAESGLFHRSLLWQCDTGDSKDKVLTLIDFPTKRNIRVPSWSWMAYKGGIKYNDPEFGSANWETKELIAPWTRGGDRATDSAPQHGDIAILATVRDFALGGRQQHEADLVYDTGRTTGSDGARAQCVIVARSKEARSDAERRYDVLLVVPKLVTASRGEKMYERVGAGYMLGKFIIWDRPGIAAKII